MREIEFISYSGRYPNLCSGRLTLKVDGQEWSRNVNLFSGGECYVDKHGDEIIEKGPWELTGYEYDRLLKFCFSEEEIDEITRLINENVEQGCCGGCI